LKDPTAPVVYSTGDLQKIKGRPPHEDANETVRRMEKTKQLTTHPLIID
jgi:hypothetical protein